MPAATLHWLMGDRSGKSIVVESTETGLHVYDNPVNTLTNDPVFPAQVETLANFASVSPAQHKNTLVPNADINLYSRGLGTHHLPGGTDSNSRFIKASFVLAHSPKGNDEVENNVFEFTMYSDCMNLDKGILYFTTYDNNQINAVDMNNEDLDTSDLITYGLFKDQDIKFEN
ncbi:linear amide C-N hydrolase [Lactobacillus johnsonii]|nr:linear amide C-N hydrolase [Lactobacillus johnsonii]KRK55930.1 choloylglycine hydrolase [Lactobacillus johnsonii ATCC 33200]MCF0083554.1 linear amide C-N hydrolase [Lactobacillus johnsonii]